MEFIVAIVGVSIAIIVALVISWLSTRKERKTMRHNWKQFQTAVDQSDIENINKYGFKLLINKNQKRSQLKKMIKILDRKVLNNPKLEKLKLAASSKKHHYDTYQPTFNWDDYSSY